eukprot:217282-Chlamydomonas_euryale.AAC.2
MTCSSLSVAACTSRRSAIAGCGSVRHVRPRRASTAADAARSASSATAAARPPRTLGRRAVMAAGEWTAETPSGRKTWRRSTPDGQMGGGLLDATEGKALRYLKVEEASTTREDAVRQDPDHSRDKRVSDVCLASRSERNAIGACGSPARSLSRGCSCRTAPRNVSVGVDRSVGWVGTELFSAHKMRATDLLRLGRAAFPRSGAAQVRHCCGAGASPTFSSTRGIAYR